MARWTQRRELWLRTFLFIERVHFFEFVFLPSLRHLVLVQFCTHLLCCLGQFTLDRFDHLAIVVQGQCILLDHSSRQSVILSYIALRRHCFLEELQVLL